MKNFSERFNEQFTDLKVAKPDIPKHLEHLYADYIELITLFANYSYVTSSDIIDRLKDEGDLRKDDNQQDSFNAEYNDKNESWVQFIYNVLGERSNMYNDDYPFKFELNKLILKESLSPKNEIYLYLLISSNLDLFNKVKPELTADFETVSYFALKNYLPTKAIVKQFGKKSDYSGNAISKIKSLASDLKVEIREEELENISERNNQERGLDIIGWIPFNDDCPNIITILGQCACGKDWPSKHHDTKRYRHYLKFYRLNPINAIFVPYALAGKRGNRFYRSDDIEESTLVFERKRILELFEDLKDFGVTESNKVVKKCITYAEDIL